jgi:hypothetical protein
LGELPFSDNVMKNEILSSFFFCFTNDYETFGIL